MSEETKSFVPYQLDLLADVNTSVIPRIVEAFVQSGLDRVNSLLVALEAGDWERVSPLAHSLKGTSASVGAEALARIAGAMEAHANGEAPTMTSDIKAHWEALMPEFERARAGAEAYVRAMNL